MSSKQRQKVLVRCAHCPATTLPDSCAIGLHNLPGKSRLVLSLVASEKHSSGISTTKYVRKLLNVGSAETLKLPGDDSHHAQAPAQSRVPTSQPRIPARPGTHDHPGGEGASHGRATANR